MICILDKDVIQSTNQIILKYQRDSALVWILILFPKHAHIKDENVLILVFVPRFPSALEPNERHRKDESAQGPSTQNLLRHKKQR